MRTATERSVSARAGGKAFMRKYGAAGMAEVRSHITRHGPQPAPTVADVLATKDGRQRAAAIARELGVSPAEVTSLISGR